MLTRSFDASNTIALDKTRDPKLTYLGYRAVSTAKDYVDFVLRHKISVVLINFDSISDDDCLSLHLINQICEGSLTYFGISSDKSTENDTQIRSLIGPDLTFQMVFPKTYNKQQIDHLILLCQKRSAIQKPITFVKKAPSVTIVKELIKKIKLAIILPRFPNDKVAHLLFIFLGVIAMSTLGIITNITFTSPAPFIAPTSEAMPDNNKQWRDFVEQPDIKTEKKTVIALRPKFTPSELSPATSNEKLAKLPVVEAILVRPEKNPAKLPVAKAIVTTLKSSPSKKSQSIEPVKKPQKKARVNSKPKPELLPIATLTLSEEKKLLQYNSLAITQIQQKFYSPISKQSAIYFFNKMHEISDSSITLVNLINNITGNILSDAVDAIKKQDMSALAVAVEHLESVTKYIQNLQGDIHKQASYQNMLSRYHSNITSSEITLVNDIEPAFYMDFIPICIQYVYNCCDILLLGND